MNSDWKVMKLGSVAEVIGGGTPSTTNTDYWDGDIPWITPKDLSGYTDRYISSGQRSISETGLKNSSARILPENTILLSSRAPIGYVAISQNILTTNQGFKSLILKNGHDPRFFYYLLKSNKEHLEAHANGSTFKEISGDIVKNISFLIPDFSSQKTIADILSALDDKIELNRQICKTLEDIASTLFKSWFIDFDPVKAKAEGREPEGLSPEIAALFPESFVDSPLGQIPSGWEVIKFGELLSNTLGGDWGDETVNIENSARVAVLRGTDIPKIKKLTKSDIPIRFISNSSLAKRKLQDGDIVIEISGGTKNQPTGRSTYINDNLLKWFDCPMIPASFCRLFRPITPVYSPFLSYYLNYIYGIGKTWSYQNQSTGISNFQATIFLEKECLAVPNKELLNIFNSIISPIIYKINLKENLILDEIKNSLLPKLITGSLKIMET